MKKLQITGEAVLSGSIEVKGSKNFATKAILAALLTKQSCVLHNVPRIRDVEIILALLCHLDVEYEYRDNSTIVITADSLKSREIPQKLAAQIRVSILLWGPLLSRTGKANIPLSGGCKIGHRPVNFHFDFLKAFGVKIESINNALWAFSNSLRGCHIRLNYPSTTTTEHIILTAVLARGTTVIENYSRTPETLELIKMLGSMGAKIALNDQVIIINGVDELNGTEYSIMPDRNEAATFAIAAISCNSELCIDNFQYNYMESLLHFFDQIQADYFITDNKISIKNQSKVYKMASIETGPYPEFESDWIPLAAVLMNKCTGTGYIHERVFEKRLVFANQLSKMGMSIVLSDKCLGKVKCTLSDRYLHSALITGNKVLQGRTLSLPDLRAGAALVIAALSAKGHSIVFDDDIITRGYESFYTRLTQIGADIRFLK